jgi:hypothetical protein
MVTAMAQADQVAQVVEMPAFETQVLAGVSVVEQPVPPPPVTVQTLPAEQAPVQVITVTRPARAQVANARTSASR